MLVFNLQVATAITLMARTYFGNSDYIFKHNKIIETLSKFKKDNKPLSSCINLYLQSCFCDLSSRNYVPSVQLSLF